VKQKNEATYIFVISLVLLIDFNNFSPFQSEVISVHIWDKLPHHLNRVAALSGEITMY